MTTGATGQLGLALPVQGELSGTWGDTTNNGLTQYVNLAVAATLTLTNDGAVTLANTTGDASATNITSSLTGAGTVTAQHAIVRVTGTLTTAKVITGPSYSKTYTVVNAATGGAVTFKASGQTGVSIAVGESAIVYYNGTDYVKVSSTVNTGVTTLSFGSTGLTPSSATSGAVSVAGTLAVANGGTGLTAPGSSGNVLTSNGTVFVSSPVPAGGLTYVSKTSNYTASDKQGVLADTSAGAFTVTLPASPTTGVQVVIADAGAAFGTNNLTVGRNGSTIGGLAEDLILNITGVSVQCVYDGTTWEVYAQVGGNGGNAVTLTGVQTLTNKTIAFGSNTLTDVASLSTVQTLTGTKSFTGTSSTLAEVLTNAAEVATVSATAATGTINYDITTQSVLYYTTNASANWTTNFRASSGTSLNTALAVGQSVTVAFLVTQGATAYYNNVVQVDGTTVTPKYQGGTAPTAGNASSIDVYSYTIIKTGSATFTVLASQTKFA